MAIGFIPNSIPFLNGVLLLGVVDAYFHILDGNGESNPTLLLPPDPSFNSIDIYWQSFYLDAAATHGVSATGGSHALVH